MWTNFDGGSPGLKSSLWVPTEVVTHSHNPDTSNRRREKTKRKQICRTRRRRIRGGDACYGSRNGRTVVDVD